MRSERTAKLKRPLFWGGLAVTGITDLNIGETACHPEHP